MSITTNGKFKAGILSGSTDGRRIKVAATGSPGTTVHTGDTDPNVMDEVELHAFNSDTVPRTVTVEWGGTTSPDDAVTYTLAGKESRWLDVSGLRLKGNATPLIIKAYASATNIITIGGTVNKAE